MSPDIKVNGELVANVPDKTGIYETLDGNLVSLSMDGIEARNKRQVVRILFHGGLVRDESLRVIGLTQEGIGSSANTKKGGDGKEPLVEVTLHDRPIRVTYNPRVWVNDEHLTGGPGSCYYEERVTRHNPRWVRGHGQR